MKIWPFRFCYRMTGLFNGDYRWLMMAIDNHFKKNQTKFVFIHLMYMCHCICILRDIGLHVTLNFFYRSAVWTRCIPLNKSWIGVLLETQLFPKLVMEEITFYIWGQSKYGHSIVLQGRYIDKMFTLMRNNNCTL